MVIPEEYLEHLHQLKEILQIRMNDESLFLSACMHSSYQNEVRLKLCSHNERLEFLGDSVLSLIVSEFLYQKYPQFSEGELSHSKSKIVDAYACSEYAKILRIEPFLLLGKGEKQNMGKGRETVIADFFEAIIGAIYLDLGMLELKHFLLFHLSTKWIELVETKGDNYKVSLQELIQKKHQQIPHYEILSEEGPHHEKTFVVGVFLNDHQLGEGVGLSKKEAQQNAAKAAIDALKEGENDKD
jgi:ribonuclease-3